MNLRHVIALAFCSASSVASATTYYVDAVNGYDGADGRTTSTAWKTITPVNARTFVSGDRVLFRKGQTFNNSAALNVRGSGVTVGSYGTGVLPKLDNRNSNQWGCVVDMGGAKSSVLQDVAIINAASAVREKGVCLTGTSNRVSNVDISRVGLGVAVTGSGHRVNNSYIHDLRMIKNTPGGDDDYGAMGVQVVHASNLQIDHNRFERLSVPSYDYGSDGSAVEFYGGSTGVQIFNNQMKDLDAFTEAGGSNASEIISGLTYHHNLVQNVKYLGYFHVAGGQTNFGIRFSNVKIDNNTFIKTSTSQVGSALGFAYPPAANTFYIRNNIFEYRNVGTLIYRAGGTVHQGNLYHLTSVADIGYSLGSTEKQGDPRFVSLSGGNFHLTSSSPAVNTGLNLGYLLDIEGKGVSGSAPDRGAYEFTTSTAPATPTQPSTCN